MADIPIRLVSFERAVRLVPSRFPPVGVFDRVLGDPADALATLYVEGLTNARLRAELGQLWSVAQEDWIAGPGTTPVMAAFTHPNVSGTRFSDGTYGVYYAAGDEATALQEARYSRGRYLRLAEDAPQALTMRMYVSKIAAEFHDIRGLRQALADVYDPDNYTVGQALGRRLREQHSFGIVYDSVRNASGECVAVFRPPAVRPVMQTRHFQFIWDGARITDVLRVTKVA